MRHTFAIPGKLKRRGSRRWENVSFYLDADCRGDALWQAHHGWIETTVAKDFPNAEFKYDLRKMRKQDEIDQ